MGFLGRLSALTGLLLWFATPVVAQTTSRNLAITVTGQVGAATPVLVQHVASSSNPYPGNGISGNNFKVPLPNPVLAGDALVLGISYPNGTTPSVTDTLGNVWPSAATCAANNGSGNMIAAIYVLPNSIGGTESNPGVLTVGLGTATQPFQYTLSEFNNVATAAPANGCLNKPGLVPSGSLIDPGSFTPTTNNNANGGNIIWNYTASAATAGGNPTSWTAGTNFTLLDADITGTAGSTFPHASQWYLQASQASIDPAITATGDGGDRFNSVSVALKVASAGGTVPNGIHVNKILHFTQGQGGGTLNLQAPVTGNLRVLAFSLAGSVSSITDNDTGSSWTIEPQSDNPAAVIAFSPNRGPLSMLSLTVHWGSINYPTSMRFFDVQGAAAAPFDAVASVPSNVACAAPSVANSPTITPTTTNGLTIAGMPFGQGPGTGVTGPPNAIWDLTNYTGESDFDSMENADAVGHFYNPTLAAESWTWTFGPVSSGSCQGAQAVHFSAAD